MDVFDLDNKLLGDYCRFDRSFTPIRARDIPEGVDRIYLWPDPVTSINLHFEKDQLVSELINKVLLPPHVAQQASPRMTSAFEYGEQLLVSRRT